MVERARALAKNEEIGAAVVIVVAGDGCRSGSGGGLRECSCLCGDVGELSAVVPRKTLATSRHFEQIEIAVEIVIKEHSGAGVCLCRPLTCRRQHSLGCIFEDDFGSLFINQVRLGAG